MLQGIALERFVAAMIALAGALVGVGIGFLLLPGQRRIKKLQVEIADLRREYAEYRSRVGTHFQTTARLVGEMTASYKAVYDHLADGAQVLCAGAPLTGPAFAAPRLILAENVEVTPNGVAPTGSFDPVSPSLPSGRDARPGKEVALEGVEGAPRAVDSPDEESVNGSAHDDVRFA